MARCTPNFASMTKVRGCWKYRPGPLADSVRARCGSGRNAYSSKNCWCATRMGMPGTDLDREDDASGVMMIPVPKSGVLESVEGEEQARATPGIEDVQITARLHDAIAAGPKARAISGFLFARGKSPAEVGSGAAQAHGQLKFEIAERLPVEHPVTGAVPKA